MLHVNKSLEGPMSATHPNLPHLRCGPGGLRFKRSRHCECVKFMLGAKWWSDTRVGSTQCLMSTT